MSESPEKSSSGMGTIMTILAFAAGLGVITLIFDDLLLSKYNPNSSPETSFQSGQATVVLKRASLRAAPAT